MIDRLKEIQLELEQMGKKIEDAEIASNVRNLNRAAAIWWIKSAADNLNSCIHRLKEFGEVKI